MIKVIHLVPDLNFGGVESVLEILSKAKQNKMWKNIFIATRVGGRAAEAIRSQGHDVFILGKSSRIPDFALLIKLVLLFKKIRPDIVHCRCVEANFHGAIAAKLVGGNAVILEEVGLTSDRRSRLAKIILKRVYSLASAVICQSLAIRRDLKISGISHPRMPVFYNPVDPAFLRRKIRQAGTPCITAVSRLVAEKNLSLLLRAFSRLLFIHDLRIEIFGDGPLQGELKTLALNLGLSTRITWRGFCERHPRNFSRSSIFVLTSEREGHPVALLEAMAAGLPVVATAVGGVKEILRTPCRCGILVPNGDEQALVNALLKVLQKSKGERMKMGFNARKVIHDRFSPTNYSAKLFQFYKISLTASQLSRKKGSAS